MAVDRSNRNAKSGAKPGVRTKAPSSGKPRAKAKAKSGEKLRSKAAEKKRSRKKDSPEPDAARQGMAKKGDRDKRTKKKGHRVTQAVMARYADARLSDVSKKVFVADSPVHGKGLFAAVRIKANTVLGRLHGMPTYDDGIYVLWLTDELGLELTNDLKYINHDKRPNVVYSDLDVMALRDVEAGEELLHDYGW